MPGTPIASDPYGVWCIIYHVVIIQPTQQRIISLSSLNMTSFIYSSDMDVYTHPLASCS